MTDFCKNECMKCDACKESMNHVKESIFTGMVCTLEHLPWIIERRKIGFKNCFPDKLPEVTEDAKGAVLEICEKISELNNSVAVHNIFILLCELHFPLFRKWAIRQFGREFGHFLMMEICTSHAGLSNMFAPSVLDSIKLFYFRRPYQRFFIESKNENS